MAKKLSFLEVVCVALLVNAIHWHVTSSFTVDPLSSTVAEEATTAASAIEPTTPSPIEDTTTTMTSSFTVDQQSSTVAEERTTAAAIVTLSFAVDPLSSTVAEERTTALAIEPTTPSPTEETTTTVTLSFAVDPRSSTVAEEATTAAAAIEPTTSIPIKETTITGPIDCSRYPCPADKYCAVNEATNRSECVCDTFCIYGYIPVCGSDGQTHFNDCFLRVTACQTNKVITVQYKGRCVIPTSTLPPPTSTSEISEPPTTTEPTTPSSIEETTTIGPVDCSGYPCPENKYCVVNETNNRPQCICINFAPPIYDPVCGSDGQTHDNEYFLRGTACRTNTVITVQYKGRCSDPPTPPTPPTPEISEPPTTTATPPTPTAETPETPTSDFVATPTTPIPETPETTTTRGCIGFKCPIGKECVPDADSRPTCTCILICYEVYRPVCGNDFHTYDNDCYMLRSACEANTTVTILFNGRCEELTPPTTPSTDPPPTPIPETPETPETPTTTEATVTTPSVQSTTKRRRSKCRRRKHGRRYKNKGL